MNPEIPTVKPPETTERRPLHGNVLLIFGQGPTIDPLTRSKPSESGTIHGQETVNLWLEASAQVVGTLVKRNVVNDVVILGGRAGGKDAEGNDYKSEAELTSEVLINKSSIPEESVHLEDRSLDTIENIVNFLNLYDQNDDIGQGEFSINILTAKFHSLRVRLLMGLFGVPVKQGFNSESLLRYGAYTVPEGGNAVDIILDSARWDHNLISRLDDMHSVNDPDRFYQDKLGTERRTYLDRLKFEFVLMRELIEYPEKWLREIGNITNDNGVFRILHQFDELYPGVLKDKYGIDVAGQAIADSKVKLLAIPKYQGLSPEKVKQWQNEDWPENTNRIFDKLTGMRQNLPQNLT